MRAFSSIFLGLVRPAKGFDGAAPAIKWLWLPLLAILLGSVVLKAGVAAPLKAQTAEDMREAAVLEAVPEDQRAEYERQLAEAETSGDVVMTDTYEPSGDTSVSDMVFGLLGGIVGLLYTATFFFVAAKTWANPVRYTTMLTAAGLMLLPHAIRNVIQAVSMGSSGTLLQHAGLGALFVSEGQAPGIAYAIFSQVDIFMVWGLLLLLGALLSKTIHVQPKRAVSSVVVFLLVTGVLQAVPTLALSMFMGT